MKKIVLKTYAKIVAALLGVVSFVAGCDLIPSGDTRAEYGTPSADFVIKGKVVDKSSQKPIENIAIIRKMRSHGIDTARTNAKGEYELKFNDFPGIDHWIFAEDLDGTENGGLYAPDSINVNSSTMQNIKKGSGWYKGAFEKNDVNFQLKTEAEK